MSIKAMVRKITDKYVQLHADGCDLLRGDEASGKCSCAMNFLGDEVARRLTEYFSHDISFKNEEQRKAAVEMYLEE